jgi:hypothetical protein
MIAVSLICAIKVPTTIWVLCGYMLVRELVEAPLLDEVIDTMPTN